MLTQEQFDRVRDLALRLTGIELLARHQALLDRRCRRLQLQSATRFDAMLNAVQLGDPDAGRQFIGLLTTQFTAFYRHPWHFHLAAEHALWAIHRRGAARLWSAAAATGEEPYSLALALLDVGRADPPRATILATDIAAEALDHARRGEYHGTQLDALTPQLRAQFLEPSATANHWRMAPLVRNLVEFHSLNLTDLIWPIDGPFDVIFCRNVLMYLESGHRYAVLERIASLLAPDGRLILDPTEHLGPAAHFFSDGANGVYSPRALACTRRVASGNVSWLR